MQAAPKGSLLINCRFNSVFFFFFNIFESDERKAFCTLNIKIF